MASRAFEQCCIQPDPTASRVLQRGGCLQRLRAQPAPHRPGFILFPSSPRGTFHVSSLGNSSLKGNSFFMGGEGGGQGQPHMGPGPAPYQDSRAAGKHSCLHSVSRSPFPRCDVLCAESKQRLLSPSPRGSCPSLLRDSCGGWSTSPPLPPLLVHDWSRPRGCSGASQPDAPCKPWQPLPLSSCPLSSKMMLDVKPSKTHCCCCCCC